MSVEARTVERFSNDVEVMETIRVHVAPWKTSGGHAQRWVSIRLEGGAHDRLEVFIPLEVFEARSGLKIDDHIGPSSFLE